MKNRIFNIKNTPIFFAFLIFFLLMSRVLFFLFSTPSNLIGIIPDDAFYYIQIATHRAKEGIWSFDGIIPTTGFHFLYGYILVSIFKIFPAINWINIYCFISILSSLAIAFSAYLVTRIASSIYGEKVGAAAILPFLSIVSIIQSTAMMESWLVILFSALTIFAIFEKKVLSFQFGLGLFFIGLLGSLSRTDYGMLPGAFFCAILFTQRFKATPIVSRIFLVLAGAVLGVFIVLMQNYLISAQLAQSSAQTKFYWSSITDHSIYPSIHLVFSIIFPRFEFKESLLLMAFLALIVSFFKSLKFWHEAKDTVPLALLLGCVLTVIGYILFYRYNSSALQPWYSANFIAPIALLAAAVFHFIFGRHSLFPAALVFIIYFYSSSKNLFSIPWPHQAGMMHAGYHIRQIEVDSRFAAWNAGIISYFSAKPLTNIDGLTNDKVLSYIKNNTLIDYLKINKIDYIVDYKEMIDNKILRLRGGYDDNRIFNCITPVKPVDGENAGWGSSRVMLFKVHRDCI